MNTKILIGAVLVGGILVFMVLGEKENEDQAGGQMLENTSAIEVEEAVAQAEIPMQVPIYPGSVQIRTQDQTNEDKGERTITLTLETSDSVAEVNSWYRGALSSDGWAVTGDKNVAGYILIEGENGNTKVFMQAANGENGGAVITERIRVRQN